MKKNNNRGFTLAELLIVVAIIAVLTAIAIPVFTSQLEKSREATDLSNIRADYAEIQAALLTGDLSTTSTSLTLSNGHTATLAGDTTAAGDFTVEVAGFKVAQKTADWQTTDFDIAGVNKTNVSVTIPSSGTATVTYTYTVGAKADITLKSIAIA